MFHCSRGYVEEIIALQNGFKLSEIYPPDRQSKSQPRPQDTSTRQLGSKQPIVEPSKHPHHTPKFSKWPGQSRFSKPVGTLSGRLSEGSLGPIFQSAKTCSKFVPFNPVITDLLLNS